MAITSMPETNGKYGRSQKIEDIKFFSTEKMKTSVLKNTIANAKVSWHAQQKNGEDREIISEMEDREVEINQSEKEREKRLKGKKWAEYQGTEGVQQKI